MSLSAASESENTIRARRMYSRVLSLWAMDLMALRREGLDRPVSREGTGEVARPSGRGCGRGLDTSWRTDHAANGLRWRPGRLAA